MSLQNRQIAEVFAETADLLAIERGDPHRVRAFRRVAKVLEMLPEPVETMLRHGRLQRQRGIGEGAVRRIKQVLRSGTFDDHARLRARFPPSLRELLRLRGLGATRVRLIHQHLGVTSIDELELAARSGQLARLPRLGPQSAEQLLAAIAAHRRHTARLPLGRALQLGQEMIEQLRRSPTIERVSVVGSLRRKKETIGDIDFVAGADDTLATVAHFCQLPQVAQVIARGQSLASGRLHSGQQADIWVVSPQQFGAALHAFSGSQAHVVAIRERANLRGLQISEHGVFSRKDGRCLTSAEAEEEVFAAVGLPFIEPELREHGGEIEAAERRRLPQLIELGDLRGDLHMHSSDSDGSGGIRRMAEAARARGLRYIAITDHSKSLTVAAGLDEGRLRAQHERLRRHNDQLDGFRLLAGVEVDILGDGSLDLDPALLRQLDWVIASVHSQMQMDATQMTDRLIRAMESGLVDCLGHPRGRRLGRRDDYPLDLDRVLRAAARTGTAVEINANPGRLDLDSVSCRQARDRGVPVVVNSDAHSPEELAQIELGVFVARRGWLEPKDVLNTRPVIEVQERRRDRLRREGLMVVLSPSDDQSSSSAASRQESATVALARRLQAAELDEALEARLRRFLQGLHGDLADPELAAALARLDDNPLQLAFNLLAGRRPS